MEDFNINIKSKMIVFCLIACLFLTVSGVSAATLDDNSTQVEISMDTDLVSVGTLGVSDELVSGAENKSVLGSSGDELELISSSSDSNQLNLADDKNILKESSVDVKSFDELENAISEASKINIVNNLTMNKTLTISGDNLIIDGHGNTIDGLNTNRIGFYLTGNNITITNINFINFKRTSGSNYWSVIHVIGNNCTISYCNFSSIYNNNIWGSSIFFGDDAKGYNSTNLTVESCNFNDCTGDAGGVIYSTGSSSHFQIYNCNFDNITRINDHRGLFMELKSTYVEIINCTFKNSKDKSIWGKGGGIDSLGGHDFYMLNCTFTNITSLSAPSYYGESTQAYNVNIINCTFINNTATMYNGGAIVFNSKDSSISGCTFINNTAPDGYGGAVYSNAQNTVIANCEFTNNSAKSGNNFYTGPSGEIIFDSKVSELYLSNKVTGTVADAHGLRADDPAIWDDDIWSYLKLDASETTISTHTNN